MTKPKDIHDRLFTPETAAASRALEQAFDEIAAEPPRPIYERFFPSLFEGVNEMTREMGRKCGEAFARRMAQATAQFLQEPDEE